MSRILDSLYQDLRLPGIVRPLPVLEQDRLVIAWKEVRTSGSAQYPFGSTEIQGVAEASQLLVTAAGVARHGVGRSVVPRDCPPVTYAVALGTTVTDRERFLGSSAAVLAVLTFGPWGTSETARLILVISWFLFPMIWTLARNVVALLGAQADQIAALQREIVESRSRA
jgi:hypothetical protein